MGTPQFTRNILGWNSANPTLFFSPFFLESEVNGFVLPHPLVTNFHHSHKSNEAN